MVEYRNVKKEDAGELWEFLKKLDTETDFMMYEPGEREQCTSAAELSWDIEENVENGGDFFRIAVCDGNMVGFLRAERGRFRRISHTAYVVTGILKSHRGQGIGTAFFEQLDTWAAENGIRRLELTVECTNQAARHLYEKSGFVTEGVRREAMCVDGEFVDEWYMAKIFVP